MNSKVIKYYLNSKEDKNSNVGNLCKKIKKEDDENVREYLFKLLQKEVD